jgi:hypothetical protein
MTPGGYYPRPDGTPMFGSGRADDRRRRVLTEELISGGTKQAAAQTGAASADADAKTSRPRTSPSNRYGAAARMDRQPRLTDLVPKSIAGLAVWFVACAAMIGGLEALYYFMPQMAAHTTDGRIAAFDLDGEGSLAVWFSSTTLAAAAGVAMIVYLLRKHRADDYHARYRIWIAAAICWFGMSVDESASLHEGFKEMMTGLTGERGFGDGSIWWVGAYGLILGAVGIKLVLEMRECLASTALLLLAGAAYAAAVVTQLNWILPDSGALGVMLEEGLEMGGNVLLLLSMFVHARHVILEIEGVVKPRKKKDKDKDKSEKSKAAEGPEPVKTGWFRRAKIDPPHGTPAPAGKTSDLEPVAKSARPSSGFRATAETVDASGGSSSVKKVTARFDDEEDDDDRRDGRKPNKADRKAMRRAKESQRRGFDDDE